MWPYCPYFEGRSPVASWIRRAEEREVERDEETTRDERRQGGRGRYRRRIVQGMRVEGWFMLCSVYVASMYAASTEFMPDYSCMDP